MEEKKWELHYYYDKEGRYIEIEILYESYWCKEIQANVVQKIAERNRKIIKNKEKTVAK